MPFRPTLIEEGAPALPSVFKLVSEHKPTGDQPAAIEKLVSGLQAGERHQTLLGITGSG